MKNIDLLYPDTALEYKDIKEFQDNFNDGRIIFTDSEGNPHIFKGLGWHLWFSK